MVDMAPYICCVTPHNRLQMETRHSLFTQTYRGHIDHIFTSRNENPIVGMNIIAAYQRLRALFLADPKYTHLWIVENDLILPPDALEKLLTVDADIVYSVYVFRRSPVVNITQIDTCNTMTDNAAYWARAFNAGAVIPCTGLGFGCTLIARHVLEHFEMRTEQGGGDGDSCLATDVRKAGLIQKAHLGVVCGHIHTDDTTLWPTARRPFYQRVGLRKPNLADIRVLHPIAAWDEHKVPMLLAPGQNARIDADMAQSFAARGWVELTTPAFKDIE